MIETTSFLAENDMKTNFRIRNFAAKYHEKIEKMNLVFKVGDKVRIVKLKINFPGETINNNNNKYLK
jgi:hypothetical protein